MRFVNIEAERFRDFCIAGIGAQELDKWCDAIDSENSWGNLQLQGQYTSLFIDPYPNLLNIANLLDRLAHQHKINLEHHSGASFGELVKKLQSIAELGGRDNFIIIKWGGDTAKNQGMHRPYGMIFHP